MRKLLGFTACLLLLSGLAAAQGRDFSKVEIKVTKVAGSVYMLVGAGGNIGVSVGEDGIVVVDDQFAPLAPKIQAALAGITDKPVRFILNTHYHFDHTGGNVEFSKLGRVVAQENVRKRLAEGSETTRFGKVPPAAKEALPIITFEHDVSIHLNGEDIRALHFPHGHTDGDSVIFFPQSNVVHMGDDFVTYGFPFVDTENGGSVSGMLAGLEKVLSMTKPDTKIIPGHGPLSTPDDVRKFITLIQETRAVIAAAVKAGKTVEQMKQEKLLAKWDADYGRDFIKTDDWIDVLYDDVSKARTGHQRYHNHGHAGEKGGN